MVLEIGPERLEAAWWDCMKAFLLIGLVVFYETIDGFNETNWFAFDCGEEFPGVILAAFLFLRACDMVLLLLLLLQLYLFEYIV